MRFATAILTAPRPKSTLGRTVESVVAAGFTGFTIYDGSPPPGHKPSPKWCTSAYIRIFSIFLNHSDSMKPMDGLLVFEDDVVCCKGLDDYLNEAAWPEDKRKIAMVSPYCPTAYSNYATFPKWHREDQRTTLAGTQAFIYTRAAMELFAANLNPEINDGVDLQMGHLAKEAGLHIWYHVPSLVQHVGIRNSAVGFLDDLGTIYSAETFVGEDFSAEVIR